MLQSFLSSERFLNTAYTEPLVQSFPLPTPDAFELFSRISGFSGPSFLLESGKGNTEVARYSFMGCNPYLVFTGKGDTYEIRSSDRTVQHIGDPFSALIRLLNRPTMTRRPGFPPFLGGAVGLFNYDLVRQFECLPQFATDDLLLPDLQFLFVELLAAVDHHTQTMYLIFAPNGDRLAGESREQLFREGRDRLAEMKEKLTTPRGGLALETSLSGLINIRGEQSRSEYMDRVRACQEFISAGDIYQANLSHRFRVDIPHIADEQPGLEGALLYQRIRQVNPSPFSALLVLDTCTIVCNSPERLVRLQGCRTDARPIAGTRPRGATLGEDRRLVENLLSCAKERAEHLMLVDLVRNDLGRVSRYGTIRVEEFMTVERYSHVAHLVSNVAGLLNDEANAFDVVRAAFPGGTITGVPKIRCMEIIEQLEPVRRGPYTGSIGYVSWTGDMDLNIIIRTLLLMKGRGYIQVGAGIVADSNPAHEYEETMCKAQAFFQAFQS